MNGLTFLIIIAAMGYMIWNWQNERSKLTRQRLEEESAQANKVVMTPEQQKRSEELFKSNYYRRLSERRAAADGWRRSYRGEPLPEKYKVIPDDKP